MPGAPISRIIDTISNFSIKKGTLQEASSLKNVKNVCIQATNQEKDIIHQNKTPNHARID